MPFESRFSIRGLRSDLALRDLIESNFRIAECSACGAEVSLRFVPSDDPFPCAECEYRGVYKLLDRDFLRRCSARFRRRVRRDPQELLRLKSWWMGPHGEDAPPPVFPEPFAWLNSTWAVAGKPRGRPFDYAGKLTIAGMLFELQRELGPAKPKSLPFPLLAPAKCDPKCTSLHLRVRLVAELLDLGDDSSALRQRLEDHWALNRRDGKDRVRLCFGGDEGVQRKIVRVVELIQGLRGMSGFHWELGGDPQELSALARWAVRQWQDPMARLEGERIRPGRQRPRLDREPLPPCRWEWLPTRPDGTIDVTRLNEPCTVLPAKGAKK